VILITTKQAKQGEKLKIDFSTQFSISSPDNRLELLNAEQVTDIVNTYQHSNDSFRAMLGSSNTDWQDQIYRTALGTDNRLSISGATGNLPYRLTLGYLNNEGILKTGDMQRISGGVNLNPRLFDNHLKIDISLKGSNVQNNFANTGAISSAILFDPTQPVSAAGFDQYDGYFLWRTNSGDLNTQAAVNPLLLLNWYKNQSDVWRGIASAQIDYRMHFLPELRANLNLGYDYAKGGGDVFIPTNMPAQVLNRLGGQDTKYGETQTNKLLEFYLNYNKKIESIKSVVDVVAGYSYQDWCNVQDNYTDYLADGTVYKEPTYPQSESQHTLVSFFGRLNYTFAEKYLFTATVRRDGSSRFHPDNRWGTFPSAALAWQIGDEDFMKSAPAVSQLKLRIGYGQTGQQDIFQDYPYLARYGKGSAQVQYQFGDQFYTVYRPAAYDQEIKWETTDTYNAGIDYGFLKNRITGSIDFYIKQTSDLLNYTYVAAGSNFSNRIFTNIGNMENRGVEFSINAALMQSKDIDLNIGFNIAYNTNKITKLTLVDDPSYKGIQAGWITGGVGGTVQLHSVGYSMYSFYLYEQVFGADKKPIEGAYVDQNNDGLINEDDLVHFGSAEPYLTGGLNVGFRWRDLSVGANLRGSLGNYLYNNVASNNAVYSALFRSTTGNAPVAVLESGFYQQQPLSNYYLEDASFLKMDNLSFSYNLKQLLGKRTGLTVNCGVQNLFTLTAYSGIDPEISGGVDRDFYPRPRIYTIGFNLNF
jgi:iron complex outermembrane receptor protein